MKFIKTFERFKNNNIEGNLITIKDILNCIKKDGVIYSSIIIDYPDNDPETPLKPIDIDEDGLISILTDDGNYTVDIKDVERIEYDSNITESYGTKGVFSNYTQKELEEIIDDLLYEIKLNDEHIKAIRKELQDRKDHIINNVLPKSIYDISDEQADILFEYSDNYGEQLNQLSVFDKFTATKNRQTGQIMFTIDVTQISDNKEKIIKDIKFLSTKLKYDNKGTLIFRISGEYNPNHNTFLFMEKNGDIRFGEYYYSEFEYEQYPVYDNLEEVMDDIVKEDMKFE